MGFYSTHNIHNLFYSDVGHQVLLVPPSSSSPSTSLVQIHSPRSGFLMPFTHTYGYYQLHLAIIMSCVLWYTFILDLFNVIFLVQSHESTCGGSLASVSPSLPISSINGLRKRLMSVSCRISYPMANWDHALERYECTFVIEEY